MHRLEIQQAEIMRIAVQQEIQRSEVSRYDHRLHGILMVCSGFSCNQVAQMFGHSPRTVQNWVKRFDEIGFAGLEDIPRPGRPAKLDERLIELIGQDLRRSPRDLGYNQNLWDGKLLSHHLSERFGVHIGVRQCQRLFRQLGFRRRKPRPLIAKADPEAQSRYKKTQKAGRKKKP
jgi:transposase